MAEWIGVAAYSCYLNRFDSCQTSLIILLEGDYLKKKKNIPFIIFSIIFVLGLIALGLYLFSLHKKEEDFAEIRDMKKDVVESEKEEVKELGYYLIDGVVVQEGLKDVYLSNSDTIGWLKIDDTNIDYPVLYNSEDENFYLHSDFNKEYSFNGSIFAGAGADITKPSENLILYGHHIIGGKMFGALDSYEDEDFYKEHKYITFDSLKQTGTCEVIAVFRSQDYPDNYEGFKYFKYINLNEEEYSEYIKNIKELSSIKTDVTASYPDQLITLSTCAYHTTNGRFVVVAKRVDGVEVDLDKEPIEIINTKGE